MSSDQPVTRDNFRKRLVNLCLRSGLSGFPKDHVNQHILFKSAVLTLGNSGILTEREVNEKLTYWLTHISQIKNIDHITLRRRLVDTGYLTRNKDGSCYQISLPGPGQQFFDDTVDQLDIIEVIKTGREEITRRKKEYIEKSGLRAKDK